MILFGVGPSTLIVLALLLIWLRFNRSLSLIGSALAGAVFMSSLMDALWSWGADERGLSVVVPLLFAIGVLFLIRWEELMPTRRWVAFGLVATFMLRALIIAPNHVEWSGRLSGNVRDVLVLAGLDPSSFPKTEELPPRILRDVEMPCGLDRFIVRSEDIQSVMGTVQLRIEACGLSPQAFRARGTETVEINNALKSALQITFAPQAEDGEYFPAWSVVVPPESSIEVADFKVPVGGAVLIYAPLEPQLGVVLGANGQIPGEFSVSRQPLFLKRQASDAP